MRSLSDHEAAARHYRQGHMQPIQFIVANGWDFALGNSLKYLVRFPFKGTPGADLDKSRHYIELREELHVRHMRPPIVQRKISMDDFIAAQGAIASEHAAALLALEMYALNPSAEARSVLFSFIEKLKSGLTSV